MATTEQLEHRNAIATAITLAIGAVAIGFLVMLGFVTDTDYAGPKLEPISYGQAVR